MTQQVAKRARLRHALRLLLRHARRAERVAARQRRGLARRLEADEALVGLVRRLAEPVLLRLSGGREDVRLAPISEGRVPVNSFIYSLELAKLSPSTPDVSDVSWPSCVGTVPDSSLS